MYDKLLKANPGYLKSIPKNTLRKLIKDYQRILNTKDLNPRGYEELVGKPFSDCTLQELYNAEQLRRFAKKIYAKLRLELYKRKKYDGVIPSA